MDNIIPFHLMLIFSGIKFTNDSLSKTNAKEGNKYKFPKILMQNYDDFVKLMIIRYYHPIALVHLMES